MLTSFTALALSACSAAALPTSPTSTPSNASTAFVPSTQVANASSVAQPSLVGAWRGTVSSKAVRAGLGTTVGFALSCSQRWEITSQSGAHFEGQMMSQGSSPETDWRCLQSRSFTGDMTAENRVTISFSPSFRPGGCPNVSGGDTVTGSVSRESMVVDLPYRATCEMAPGGGAPQWDLEIAATLTLTPW